MHAAPRSERSGIEALARRMLTQRNASPRNKLGTALACLILLAGLVATARPFVTAHLEAIAVLDLVANQPVPALLRAVIAEPVITTDVTLQTADGPIRARLYTPTHHLDAPAMVVLHGVHHLGIDEPRLIAFASAMSSCGLRVLTPELPGIKDYHIAPDSIRTIGDAAQWLAYQNPNGRRAAVGVMGLSFSGGLSLLAAADPTFQPSIKFVVAVGSQASMARIAQYYRTGADAEPTGADEFLPPHEYGALVMEYAHPEDFVPKYAVERFRKLLRAHLYEDVPAEQAALAAFTPAEREHALKVLDTKSPDTRALLAAEETRHVQDMTGVSPQGHLKDLITPVYLLHGAGDNIIPSAETLWMAAELPTTSLQTELISPVLSHLDLDGAQPSTLDRLRLVHFFALVLHAAHRP